MFFFRKKEKKLEQEEKKLKREFDNAQLEQIISYIKLFCGVDLEPKQDILSKRLQLFCEPKEIYSFTELLNKIKSDDKLLQMLINEVTINETYFFRELPQLEESIEHAKNLGKKIKILCAPCATGEEIYSLAILAIEKGIATSNIEFFGIDINSEAIERASEGAYSERSLHRLTEEIKTRYFTQKEKLFYIKKSHLPQINFKVINIFDENFKKIGLFDIVFSRNMMIYFDDTFKQKAIKIFHDLLEENGRLYTGHADLVPQNPLFKKEVYPKFYFYSKIKSPPSYM